MQSEEEANQLRRKSQSLTDSLNTLCLSWTIHYATTQVRASNGNCRPTTEVMTSGDVIGMVDWR